MYLLYILIALIFVLSLISFMPVSAELRCEYIEKVQKTELLLRLFKIIKITIPINAKKDKKGKTTDDKNEKKQKFGYSKIKKLLGDIKDTFSDTKSEIYAILSSLKNHLVINRVLFEMEYGLSNAAKTGMANGALWASASGALSVIDNISEIKSVTLNIYPNFSRECFNIRFVGIITLRFAHIISIGIKLLKIINHFIKISEKN